jgi:hypothetical protein
MADINQVWACMMTFGVSITILKVSATGSFIFNCQLAWTWLQGPSSASSFSTSYGTAFSTSNKPGGRIKPASFRDPGDPNLIYIHGGDIMTSSRADLWAFNIQTKGWRFVSGSSNDGFVGSSSYPAARSGHVCVEDPLGSRAVYCYSGIGCTSINCMSFFADMWKYNITSNNWTWISGKSSGSGVENRYSVGLGIENATNTPGGRSFAGGWSSVDQKSLFFFGGMDSTNSVLNDLWRFNVQSHLWTWIHGSLKTGDSVGSYMSRDFNSLNYPRGRFNFSTALLSPSNGLLEIFVLHGGFLGSTSMDDVWYYSPSLNQFRWVYGSSTYSSGVELSASYNAKMTESVSVSPGSRGSSVFTIS